MNIQAKQRNPKEPKNDISLISTVNEIEMVKELDLVYSSNKLSKPTRQSSKPIKVYFKPKTTLVNKLRMNMKVVLNPKFKKNQFITLHDSSSEDEEGKQYKELESVLHQVLKNIDRSPKRVPKIIATDYFKNLEMRIWKRIPHHYSLE